MNYQEKLKPWLVQQISKTEGETVLGRFRRQPEAEAYLHAMQQRHPYAKLSLVFATEPKVQPISAV
ncbi:MAG: hypothetical protein VKJ64_16715 [Leptolyngbyaceae bacterium]|nr:hypothetical protein [Leptolyngbyaceae bacterium]